MVRRHVRVYIEGGSEGPIEDSDFRRGWKVFLSELHSIAIENGFQSLEVVRGRGRGQAFDSFKKHRNAEPDDLCVLLADAETAVRDGTQVWDVVARREGDKWKRPPWATARHLYLMVHFVETWLVADPSALTTFFKRGFEGKYLPTGNLEQRSKGEIETALKRATAGCAKGQYRHGQAHEIIGLVNPDAVKELKHGSRLFTTLAGLIRGEPDEEA